VVEKGPFYLVGRKRWRRRVWGAWLKAVGRPYLGPGIARQIPVILGWAPAGRYQALEAAALLGSSLGDPNNFAPIYGHLSRAQ